jgi:hypothetical protein
MKESGECGQIKQKDFRVKSNPLDIRGSYSKPPLKGAICKDIKQVDGIPLNTTNKT